MAPRGLPDLPLTGLLTIPPPLKGSSVASFCVLASVPLHMLLPVPGIHLPTPFADSTSFAKIQLRHPLLWEVLLTLTSYLLHSRCASLMLPGLTMLTQPSPQVVFLRAETVLDLPLRSYCQKHLALLCRLECSSPFARYRVDTEVLYIHD